jgi:hypothetical protein
MTVCDPITPHSKARLGRGGFEPARCIRKRSPGSKRGVTAVATTLLRWPIWVGSKSRIFYVLPEWSSS